MLLFVVSGDLCDHGAQIIPSIVFPLGREAVVLLVLIRPARKCVARQRVSCQLLLIVYGLVNAFLSVVGLFHCPPLAPFQFKEYQYQSSTHTQFVVTIPIFCAKFYIIIYRIFIKAEPPPSKVAVECQQRCMHKKLAFSFLSSALLFDFFVLFSGFGKCWFGGIKKSALKEPLASRYQTYAISTLATTSSCSSQLVASSQQQQIAITAS